MKKIKILIPLFSAATFFLLALATFLERAYGIQWAHDNIYGAPWFVCWWGLLGAALLFALIRRPLWRSDLPAFLLHLSFLVILSGGLLTFLFGEKGMIHLRQNQTTRSFYLEDGTARELPFALTLRRFSVLYYPGTDAVSDYVSEILYADPLHAPAPAAQLYPAAPPPAAEDLGEDGTFITFTPYLRALAAELTEGAEDDLHRAWRIYEFITTKVKYSFVRQYFQIDSIGEYCALNLKGDCGLQALLFISLCRICGIPARWQSGLSISADDPGSHDWAQFYLPGWGWLFADPSFGGGAWRSGARARWLFYFGNLDPARMAAASCFMAEFSHPAAGLRVDPFDNQTGEIERIGRPLPFVGRELDETERVLLLEELP